VVRVLKRIHRLRRVEATNVRQLLRRHRKTHPSLKDVALTHHQEEQRKRNTDTDLGPEL